MINDAMQRLELTDKMRVLKIGDTIVDVQEAKNAGVFSAGILSGTTEKTDFEVEGPDYIFNTLDDLLLLIKE